MKKLSILIILFITTFSLPAQDITGTWNGILKIQGIQLSLVFHISETADGYSSTMDSPDQGGFDIAVTTTSFENSTLALAITSAGIEYEGVMGDDGNFVGTFKQGGQSLPLELSRAVLDKEVIVKPQEPTEPFPYYSEEVTFENKAAEITLAGTLTLPEKEGVFPVVVLISGSGAQNRDEELLGHKPFLVLSDHLTRNGIGVLRYDDRGTAESTGDFALATSADFATDVHSAIAYLKSRDDVDHTNMGLVGHSEGGLIAPICASESQDIAFIALLAGPGLTGADILLAQSELINRANGMADSTLQTDLAILKGVLDIVTKYDNVDYLNDSLTHYLINEINKVPDPEIPGGLTVEDYVAFQVQQLTSPWMNYFIKYDPIPALEKVSCPVLAITGEKDLQVPPKENLEAIKAALKKGGNENVTIKELPGLNHLFQECETGGPSEYAEIEQTFSPIALSEISNWIKAQVK